MDKTTQKMVVCTESKGFGNTSENCRKGIICMCKGYGKIWKYSDGKTYRAKYDKHVVIW